MIPAESYLATKPSNDDPLGVTRTPSKFRLPPELKLPVTYRLSLWSNSNFAGVIDDCDEICLAQINVLFESYLATKPLRLPPALSVMFPNSKSE